MQINESNNYLRENTKEETIEKVKEYLTSHKRNNKSKEDKPKIYSGVETLHSLGNSIRK